MAARMKDIARDLGVSVVTVSKVLRNHTDIGEETRRRVLQRMKELNYQPNFAARALVTGRSYTVGLVVPDLVHPFFAEVAKSLASTLRRRGYSLIITSSEEDPELEMEEIDRLLARGLDAIAIASTQVAADSLRRLDPLQARYILIDRRFEGLRANFVGSDDRAAGELATTHLIEQGCRRIAHIRGPEVSTALGRLEGYRRALAAHRLPAPPTYIPAKSGGDVNSEARGHDAMRQLLQAARRPDGVFCYNDPTAMGAVNAILESGLRVPKDIAVIGCGNVHYDASLRVPLSSVDQQSAAIGERTAKLALSLIEAKTSPPPRSVVLAPRLVIRASSQRLPS